MTAAPLSLEDRVRLLLSGELEPVTARFAATVALVRDGDAGLEVYLLRRVRQMSFAAGMHVFPGGALEPADQLPGPEWSGPSPLWWAERFGTSESLAAGLVRAAVRETFEESGVLLAGPSADEIVKDVSSADWEDDRERLEAGQQSLAELLSRRGLLLRADLLAPVAHWITPEAETKRFDTHFFVAALPSDQIPRDVGTEADHRLWIRPGDALAAKLKLLPPTKAVLRDLAEYDTVESALRTDRVFGTVEPRVVVLESGGTRLVIDPDPAGSAGPA